MRIPLSWLSEYVSLPSNTTADSVMAELVKVGLEEEGSHRFDIQGPVVVGEVLEFVEEAQSNGKTIRWCQLRVAVDGQKAADGGAAVRGIVCGARNFFVGDKVVVTLPGSVLPGDFKIAARSTYGHTSDGMIASARELGLSDDHEGILRLATLGIDVPVGTDALDLLKLNDSAAEVNVTPDRGYCFSIRGIAREFSHATGASFTDPATKVTPVKPKGFDLKIEDNSPIRGKVGASKFVVVAVNGLDATSPTPAWMISRLKLAGMRSISVIVDITNYVMLELGQPIHAYDLDKLSAGFGARRAKPNEALITLDGQERKLNAEDYLIVDSSGPIGLAGVMGGLSTEVSATTKNVLIEAANFDPVSISRTARRHKLPSEASKRFERGVDPKIAEYAAARVAELLGDLAGGKLSELGAIYDTSLEVEKIQLAKDFAAAITGVEYSVEQITQTLTLIGCAVIQREDSLEVTPPSWRPDLTLPESLVEEVARILGYDQIPSRLPVAPPGRGLTRKQKLRRLVANSLAANGFTEVLNYPFVTAAQNSDFIGEDSSRVVLANPLQAEVNEMRLSLLPGLLEAAARNSSRTLVNLSIFEIGSIFQPAPSSAEVELPIGGAIPSSNQLKALGNSVPTQPIALAALMLGDRVGQQVGKTSTRSSYLDAIGAVRALASLLSLEIKVEQVTQRGFHPGRTAAISSAGVLVGYAGEIHPEITANYDLPRQVSFFELNLDALIQSVPDLVTALPIHTLPAATQDLSLVIDVAVPAAEVLDLIRESAGELLEEVVLVDDFRGGNLKGSEKSLTFSLRFRAIDRTLTQVEATEAKDAAVQAANARFGATIRS
ncbi:MAG: phenylalanine--tRNA ligase subunit beta [Rhodoluna sp.]|jgi:phenylalanyl-tRNA synthetase beta chain